MNVSLQGNSFEDYKVTHDYKVIHDYKVTNDYKVTHLKFESHIIQIRVAGCPEWGC